MSAREYLNETGLASLWAKIVNKINALGDLCVKKAGDTMTGILYMQNTKIVRSSTSFDQANPPNTNRSYAFGYLTDKDANVVTRLTTTHESTSGIKTILSTNRLKAGTTVTNEFAIGVDEYGRKYEKADGRLVTSFKSSVAMGSYGSAQTTIPNLCNEIRMSSGCTGSVSITTAFTKSSVTIPTGWYNFIYSPHRSGGFNGEADGDNCNYGTLILSSMTAATPRTFMLRVSSDANENYVNSLREIWTTNQGHLAIGGTLVVTFNGSGARDVAISNFTGLTGKPTNMMVSCQSATAAFIDYDYDNSSNSTIRLNAVGLTSSGTYQKLNGNYRIGWMAMV